MCTFVPEAIFLAFLYDKIWLFRVYHLCTIMVQKVQNGTQHLIFDIDDLKEQIYEVSKT